jgi:hypothetical protein
MKQTGHRKAKSEASRFLTRIRSPRIMPHKLWGYLMLHQRPLRSIINDE